MLMALTNNPVAPFQLRHYMLKINFLIFGLMIFLLSLTRSLRYGREAKSFSTPDKKDSLISEKHCCSLKYGPMMVRIDPSVGARVVSFRWNDDEFLIQKTTEPDYFGATFWPDPQNKWWPVDSALDGKPYTIIKNDKLNIHLLGKQSRSGLRFEKFFSLRPGDSSLHIVYKIYNSGKIPLSVGPWELIRTKEGLVFYPGKLSHSLPRSDLEGVKLKNQMIWYFQDSVKASTDGKLFSYSLAEWMACAGNKLLFIKSFPFVTSREVAPGQGTAEIYTNAKRTYLELETHGKFTKLQPGGFITYEVSWYLRPLSDNILLKTGSPALIGYVEQLLGSRRASQK